MRNYVAAVLLILVLICSGCSVSKESIEQQHKVSSSSTVFQLDGTWQMYPNQLLEPQDLPNAEGITVSAPLSFQRILGNAEGYATFYRQVEIDSAHIETLMSVYSQYMYTAYKLYIDGQLIMQAGQVGQDKQSSIPEMQAKIGYFIPEDSKAELVLQISNFHHQQGGVNNDFVIGTAAEVSKYYHYQLYNMFFQMGSVMIMGLFAILISILARSLLLFFMYGCFCILIALRALFSGTMFAAVLLPDVSWLGITRIEYVITVWVSVVYLISIYLLYRDVILKYIIFIAALISSVLTIVTLLTEVSTFQLWFKWLYMICIPIFCYTLVLPIIRLRKKELLALWLVTGSLLMLAAVVNDYLSAQNVIATREMTMFGALALVVCQAVFVSYSYTNELKRTRLLNNELQVLNETLDEKVQLSMQAVIKDNEQLQQQIWIDGLTKIYNRKYFNEQFDRLFHDGQHIGLILIDIDDFKRYNDTYGHVAGDKLLFEFVQAANREVPSNGFIARYGGEEFAVVLTNSSKEQSLEIAEAIRQAVEALQVEHVNSSSSSKIVTVSLGVSFMKNRKRYSKPHDLITEADQALYQAKHNGRNQVRMQ